MVIYVCLSFKPLVTTIPGFPGIPSRPDMSNPESRKGRRDGTRPTSSVLILAQQHFHSGTELFSFWYLTIFILMPDFFILIESAYPQNYKASMPSKFWCWGHHSDSPV